MGNLLQSASLPDRPAPDIPGMSLYPVECLSRLDKNQCPPVPGALPCTEQSASRHGPAPCCSRSKNPLPPPHARNGPPFWNSVSARSTPSAASGPSWACCCGCTSPACCRARWVACSGTPMKCSGASSSPSRWASCSRLVPPGRASRPSRGVRWPSAACSGSSPASPIWCRPTPPSGWAWWPRACSSAGAPWPCPTASIVPAASATTAFPPCCC